MSLVPAGEGPLRRLPARRGGSLPSQLPEEADDKVREVISKTRGRPCSAVAYLKPHRVKKMGVDVTRDELLTINIDMTYPGLPCQAAAYTRLFSAQLKRFLRDRAYIQGLSRGSVGYVRGY